MSKRKSPNPSVVGPVSKPSLEEWVRFLDRWECKQWPELRRQLGAGLLPFGVVQKVIEHKNPFEGVIITDYERLLNWHAGWPRFWRAFGFKYDHDALVLPEHRVGFGWSIVTPDLAEWPTSRLLHEVCGRMFQTWQYYDDQKLDKTISPKEPTGVHVVVVRDRIEADEEHKNKSALTIKSEKIPSITIRQREVLEARYFFESETNEHLDVTNLTVCAGSRYADGLVPHAYWSDDKFFVGRVGLVGASGDWRVREVVSLPAGA